MRKVNLIWVFVAFVLGGALFFLGMHYGETDSVLTGNIVRGEENKDLSDILENNLNDIEYRLNNLEVLYKNPEEPIIFGGGWVKGPFHGVEEGVGEDCQSWGLATCLNSSEHYSNKVELKCPEGYGKMPTGIYTPNPASSENVGITFMCVINRLVENQSQSSVNTFERSEEFTDINILSPPFSENPPSVIVSIA